MRASEGEDIDPVIDPAVGGDVIYNITTGEQGFTGIP
jgi:hypothetical protein